MSEVFKLYGVSVEDLNAYLLKSGVKYCLSSSVNGIKVTFDYSNLEESFVYSFLSNFTLKYQKNIYAESDETLANQLIKIAKLRNIKIKTAESFTGGSIASELSSISGASQVFYEGIVAYSNQAKINRLSVSENTIKSYGAVSSQTASQMCKALIDGSETLAISTTGIAGPSSDESGQPVGLCYIAVGSESKIKVFKHNFSGTREQITKQGKYAAIFHAVMALRSSDFDI